jgi:hypothetical protein
MSIMPSNRRCKRKDTAFQFCLALFLALACFFTYLVNLVAEETAFRNLSELSKKKEAPYTLVSCPQRSWWYVGDHIKIKELHLQISCMSSHYFWVYVAILAVASLLLFGATLLLQRTRHRRYLVAVGTFVLVPGVWMFLHPQAGGIFLASLSYAVLFFTARGLRDFNPHWELKDDKDLNVEKFQTIARLFDRYALASVAVVAFIFAACFYNANTLLKDAVLTFSADIYRAVQFPFVLTVMFHGLFGSGWLAGLIFRELHIKQHELLLMRIIETPRASDEAPGTRRSSFADAAVVFLFDGGSKKPE